MNLRRYIGKLLSLPKLERVMLFDGIWFYLYFSWVVRFLPLKFYKSRIFDSKQGPGAPYSGEQLAIAARTMVRLHKLFNLRNKCLIRCLVKKQLLLKFFQIESVVQLRVNRHHSGELYAHSILLVGNSISKAVFSDPENPSLYYTSGK